MAKPTGRPNGRPSKYTQELADLICKRVATHTWGIQKLCRTYDDMPTAEIIRIWRLEKPQFFAQYARAKALQGDLLAEDCLDIADDDALDFKENEDGFPVLNHEHIQRSRVRIDTRKWLASKLVPKQYGDRIEIEQKTEENERLKAELLELKAKLDAQHRKDY